MTDNVVSVLHMFSRFKMTTLLLFLFHRLENQAPENWLPT